jgi:hypothetical protein
LIDLNSARTRRISRDSHVGSVNKYFTEIDAYGNRKRTATVKIDVLRIEIEFKNQRKS